MPHPPDGRGALLLARRGRVPAPRQAGRPRLPQPGKQHETRRQPGHALPLAENLRGERLPRDRRLRLEQQPRPYGGDEVRRPPAEVRLELADPAPRRRGGRDGDRGRRPGARHRSRDPDRGRAGRHRPPRRPGGLQHPPPSRRLKPRLRLQRRRGHDRPLPGPGPDARADGAGRGGDRPGGRCGGPGAGRAGSRGLLNLSCRDFRGGRPPGPLPIERGCRGSPG